MYKCCLDLSNHPILQIVLYIFQAFFLSNPNLQRLENFVHVSEEEEKVFNSETQKIEVKKSTVLIFPRYHQLNVTCVINIKLHLII